jgi:phosphoribosyl 1,2-cyclic phosphodiesterase
MVDASIDREIAKRDTTFSDDGIEASTEATARRAALAVVTHEHQDHIAGPDTVTVPR